MSQDFKHFLKLRDDLYVAMSEAIAERVASETLEDGHYIVAAILAALVACTTTTINCTDPSFKERWTAEFIEGLKKTLLKSSSATDENTHTLH
jgi:hypothetical protein